MGRKSSAKSQQQRQPSGASPTPPPDKPRRLSPVIIVAALLVVAAGAFLLVRSSSQETAPATAALPTVVDPPEAALHGPHPQDNLPPLPFDPAPPARPMDVVRAAYKFAAEHPEVLSYVPCYCGCEHSGHRGNEDCFVTRRDAKGDVVEWEPHGMT